jgi:hypothetical protein
MLEDYHVKPATIDSATWIIERLHLQLPAVRKAIRVVHTGRRSPSIVSKDTQGPLFIDIGEV